MRRRYCRCRHRRLYSDNTDILFGHVVYADNTTFRTALDDFLAEEDNARFVTDVAFDNQGNIEVWCSGVFLLARSHHVRPAAGLRAADGKVSQFVHDRTTNLASFRVCTFQEHVG